MTALKLVSIVHPSLVGRVPLARLGCLERMDVTVIASEALDHTLLPPTTTLVRLPARGRHRLADYPNLRPTLGRLGADVLHLHADPTSVLAFRLSRTCASHRRPSLVLDCEIEGASARRFPWRWLARQTLSRVDALVARDHGTLATLRSLGLRGPGIVAGSGVRPGPLAQRAQARRALDLPDGVPVFGWTGPLDRQRAVDLLEAVTICERDLVLLIPTGEPLRSELIDRADALDVLGRIRAIAPEPGSAAMLAAVDALILAASADRRVDCHATVGQAQSHGIPIIYMEEPSLAELIGHGGWPVRAEDPGLLARLLDEVGSDPARRAAASQAALAEAAERNSPEAAATKLASAIWGAHLGPRRNRVPLDSRRMLGFPQPGDEREASRT